MIEPPPVEYFRAVEIAPDGREWALPLGSLRDQVHPYLQRARTSVNIASLGGRREKGYTYRIDRLVVADSEDA